MKAKVYDGTDARRVLTGMIVNNTVATRLAAKWKPEGLFDSRWENKVALWCVEHARKYGKAPGQDILTIFATAPQGNEDETASIERLLAGLSEAYEREQKEVSAEYLLDLAGDLFNRVAMRRDAEAVLEELDRGDVKAATARFSSHRAVEFGPGAVDRPDVDPQYWADLFIEEDEQPLITWPEKLGAFLGGEFARDSFIAFQASEKTGKSWWLLDVVVRGLRQRRTVAYFSVGDMSRKQVGRRLGRRLTRLPKRPGEYKIPSDWPVGQEFPNFEIKYLEAWSQARSWGQIRKFTEGENRLRLGDHPAGTMTADGIGNILKDWAKDGWVADIVVIDYADILAKPAGQKDPREGVNETWMSLRRISQELHCCLVTATQADAASYGLKLMSRKNFSNDKRKYAHVTAMLAINQTPEEKTNGVQRLQWLARREEDYSETQCVKVAGCLDIGCPAITSV